MDRLIYWLARLFVAALQSLPLVGVAWLGRRAGALAYWLDARHRRVALRNLQRCLGDERNATELRRLARENFRRLGENYCSAIKTATMPWSELSRYVQFIHPEMIPLPGPNHPKRGCIVAIGHFGNFELYARFGELVRGYRCATTYRALRQPSLNRLLQSLRERSGCSFFERRTEAGALKAALADGPVLLGLLADQHAGERGVAAPFFGQNCSTSAAPAILALRYRCPLYTGICYRIGLGRWQIEAGEEIPTTAGEEPRSLEAIAADINRAFERAVRRDPANWFWVHNRWKPFRSRTFKMPQSAPPGETREEDSVLPLS